MTPALETLRNCLDGNIPSAIATCAPDGTPNVAYLSHVHYVDSRHVALSFQFFNKTRENVLQNPHATVQVIDPDTAAHYLLTLEYQRTETSGPLYENMKAKLASIASHTGMSKVFRLLGSDVYRVFAIESVALATLPPPAPRRSLLPSLRACTQELAGCTDLATLLDATLAGLERHCEIRHAMLLMLDARGERLYTVASRGYPVSGVGSEIPLGVGVIGVAARERTAIRIGHMAQEYSYNRAIRQALEQGNPSGLETEIPPPGLPDSRSQLAVPILLGPQLKGVLFVESPEDLRFTYEDEDALVTLCAQLAMSIHFLEHAAEAHEETTAAPAPRTVSGAPLPIRCYTADHSVFIGNDYLIKGVAGAIFWKLLRDYTRSQRTEFSNRELRLDPSIRLPDISDNLEARLILLQRRLAERCDFLRIEKTGRGRFRLRVDRPVKLTESETNTD